MLLLQLRLGTQSLIQVIQAFTRHSNQNLIDEDQTDFNNFLNNNRSKAFLFANSLIHLFF